MRLNEHAGATFRRTCSHAAALVALLCASAAPAAAQAGESATWLPGVRHFASLHADPLEPRSSGALIHTNLLGARGRERPPFGLEDEAAAAREVQAVASLGATVPLARLGEWAGGGAVLAVQAGVVARFRIEKPGRDDLGQDWFVAFPVEAAWGAWSARGRLSHRSSHLGDEFMIESGAARFDFGGEALDAHVARALGGTRLYAGGTWIFRSYAMREPVMRVLGLEDRLLAQFGVDGGWALPRRAGTELVGGIDVQFAERTGWRRQLAAVGGVRVHGARHALRLQLRFFDGPSFMGQFFLTPERLWALEAAVEL